ncbi:FAS-associated death domain protein [Paramormyrops kingsleyae]|uniref:FAS-associated death domain protein n=1 Tax=Paramormyrops kingsleyae TaxID=1676925 RepID=UPI003B97C65E
MLNVPRSCLQSLKSLVKYAYCLFKIFFDEGKVDEEGTEKMDTFASVLLRISDGLKKDHLEAMKFLCSDDIGKKKLEKVDNGIQLFQYLREMQKIGMGNTQYLRTLLTNIKRPDLLEILDEFEKHGSGPQEDLPDAKEQDKLDIATQLIAENLGKDWRMYGRKLGIKDAKLDHIREKHPYNLQEQVIELIQEWRKMHGAKASAEDLIQALRKCNLNLTADLIRQKLS